MQDVMPWLGKDIVHVLFPRTLASGKDAVGALYGHPEYVRLVVPVSVGDHEHAVHVVFAEPRLHDNLCRQNFMRRMIDGCFGGTVAGWRPIQKPSDSAGKHDSDT